MQFPQIFTYVLTCFKLTVSLPCLPSFSVVNFCSILQVLGITLFYDHGVWINIGMDPQVQGWLLKKTRREWRRFEDFEEKDHFSELINEWIHDEGVNNNNKGFIFSEGVCRTNRYTKLENLAWSQTVFLQFTFCIKRRFMKPLLLSRVAIFIHNIGCLLTDPV